MTIVLGIAGSLRRGSYNRLLLHAAAELAAPELEIRVDEGLGLIPLFSEDLEIETDGGPPSVQRLRRAVVSADGVLIATPEYNWSVPGVLKNAIDWLSRAAPLEVLAGKPVAVIGASSGSWGTRLGQAALRQILTATESAVMPRPALFVREAGRVFNDGGRLADELTRTQLTEVLDSFTNWIEAVKGVEHVRR